MKSGCSAVEARRARGRPSAPFISSCHQTSRPAFIVHRARPCGGRRRTFSTVGVSASASSTFSLSGTTLPRRQPPSAVMQSLAPQSLMRSRSASAREAAEDDGVRGADARAGEHGDGHLGDHRHVDGDRVARLDAEALEHVGELADLGVQLLVGERRARRPARPPRSSAALSPRRGQVPVEAVGRDVELAADEPARPRQVPVEHLVPGLGPGQLRLGGLGPEPLRIVDRPPVLAFVRRRRP